MKWHDEQLSGNHLCLDLQNLCTETQLMTALEASAFLTAQR